MNAGYVCMCVRPSVLVCVRIYSFLITFEPADGILYNIRIYDDIVSHPTFLA
jgi:hypothetical protein